MNFERPLTVCSALLLGSIFGGALLLPSASAAVWEGYYTDQSSYAPGDTVNVHAASTSTADFQFRLLRMGTPEEEIARSGIVSVGVHDTDFGSFVDFPTVNLSGATALTLEGWYFPTLFGGDDILIAGQASASEGTLSIGIDANAQLYARVWVGLGQVEARLSPPLDGSLLLTWYHLAASYDGSTLRLYVDGAEVASAPASGPLASSTLPFRLGARAEAPGDLTGIMDGRLDSWAVWPQALSQNEIDARRTLGLSQIDPSPDPSSVLLYINFEDAYGATLSDGSSNGHQGSIVHHGMPRVAGVIPGSHALQLNHDQIVDAGFPVVAQIPLPSDAPSGLYAVQALVGPGFDESNRDADVFRAIAVRPSTPTAPIAVVIPSNTWNAYNGWPATQFWGNVTPSGMTERVDGQGNPIPAGNNSSYKLMGDGITVARYQGWRRPSIPASLAEDSGVNGFRLKASKGLPLVRFLDDMGFGFEVYSDEDFAEGRFPGFDPHRVLIFFGHDEYWSPAMVQGAQGFLQAGGAILHLGGNAITWKTVPAGDGVVEIHKYPVDPEAGPEDHFSAVLGDRIGHWRAVSQCEGNFQDVVFGTVNDEIGSPDCNINQDPNCLGLWQIDRTDHWLWEGSTVSVGDLFGVSVNGDNTVGYETDAYFPGIEPPGLAAGQEVVVLAHGTQLGGSFPALEEEVMAGMSCSELDAQVGNLYGVVTGEHTGNSGSLVYYSHEAGGAVLGISAISAPTALSADPQAVGGDTHISDLSQRFLDCFAYALGCPDGTGPAPVDPNPDPHTSIGCGCNANTNPVPRGMLGFAMMLLFAAGVLRRR